MIWNSMSVALLAILLTWTSNVFAQFLNENAAQLKSLNSQELQLYQEGLYPQAAEVAVKALRVSEHLYGPEHKITARNLMNLGMLYVQMGKYTNAEPLLLHALTINKQVLGLENPSTIICMSHLGSLYQAIGDYAKAEPYFQQCLEINQRVLGPENPDTVKDLNNLAVIYGYMGEYAKAEQMLQQVLAIDEKVPGPEYPNTAPTLQTLGMIYMHMGDYAKSESFFQRALNMQEKVLGPDHPKVAEILGGLGMLYVNIGDYGKAVPIFLRALKIQKKALGPDHPALAKILSKIAQLYLQTGNLAQAELWEKRALKIDEKSLGEDSPDTAAAKLSLGVLYEQMGDLPKAESFVQRGLAIQEKVLGPEHPSLARGLNDLGSIYVKLGKYTNAESLFLRALDIDDKVLNSDNPERTTCLANLATVYFELQNTNKALEFADKAEQSRLGMLDNILSFTSEQERLNYEAKVDESYALFASLNDTPRVALAILRHKGVVLDSLLEDRVVAKASKNAENNALIEQLGPAKQQLRQLLMTVPKDSKIETLQNQIELRDKLSRHIDQLEGTLAQNVAEFGRARRALTVTVEEVQKAIPPQAALVEFIRYHHYLGWQAWEDRYGAVILSSTGKPTWVCLGPASEIELNVLFCQNAVRDTIRNDERGLSSALRTLYKDLWMPLEKFLPADKKTIVISPDASLNFVSFATLLTPDDKFLAEKYSIHYVASGRDLLREPVKSSSQDMVMFAAPDYVAGGPINSPQTGLHLEPLPYFARNAADLEAEIKPWKWPIQIYSGVEASETRLRIIHSPRILHFSTHGFFLPETIGSPAHYSFLGSITDSKGLQQQVVLKNPMYRSGIALAGAQATLDAWKRGETPPTDTDGILTAEEVGDLDLHGTWLVVLSACDTGIGEPRAGEGVLGLRRGFAQAGAQNLLMTLWPVFVVPSGKLMLDFYSTLHQNNNPSEALAEVQRDWLVKLRSKYGLLPAVVFAGAFIVNSQGPIQ